MNSASVTASILFSTFFLYLWNYTYWRRNRVKQRFPQVPVLGDNFRHFFQLNPYHEVLQSIYGKFQTRYTGFYQYLQPGLMIRDPKLIKKICISEQDSFIDRKSFLPKSADLLWSKNIFALQGQKWRDMRNTLTPAFTGRKMRQIFHLVTNTSERFCGFLQQREGDTVEVEFKDIFTRFTTDVIASVAFGYEVDSLNEPDNEFYEKGKKAMGTTNFWKNFKLKLTLILPIFGNIFRANIFDQDVSDFFREHIRRIIDHRKETNTERPDMLQLLMHAHESDDEDQGNPTGRPKLELDNDDIASQALVFFLGGFETASNALCFMAYELAVNQDIQNRLIEEIDAVREEKGVLTYDRIRELYYLDMVFSETLRKWPPLLNMDRMCVRPYTIEPETPDEKPVHIKKSTLIWIPIWAIHHDPQYWPNPEIFDPERFAIGRRDGMNPAAYIAFGMGPRGCLGSRFASMEIKILIFHLLSKFRIVPTSESEIPFVPVTHSFSLASEKGFRFGLQKRS